MILKFTQCIFKAILLLCCLLPGANVLYAQLPVCAATGGLVYIHSGSSIYNWDPSQPLSATNPVLNTIPMPIGAGGLAVSANLNDPSAPSPTFYTTVNGMYYYYNGTTWTNTGHTAGAVNPGGGGGYIYSLEGSGGNVYKYDGTGNATFLLTVPGFSSGGPYDVVADCAGNFYILRTLAPAWMRKYSPSGVLLQEWTVTGAVSTGSGGGFAIIDDHTYHHNSGLQGGIIGPTTVTCSPIAGTFPSPSDFASCPIGGNAIISINDTVFNCTPGTAQAISTPSLPPYSYQVINGTATVTGSGPSFNVTNNLPATVILHGTANSLCNSGPTSDTFLIVPMPAVNAGADDTLFGCATYMDTLHGQLSDATGWINYMYNWSPAGVIVSGGNTIQPVIAPLTDTTFVFEVSTSAAQGNCVLTDSVRIHVKDESILPDFNFVLRPGCHADSVRFTSTSVRSTASLWDFGDGFTDTITNPVHVYPAQDLYEVKLVSSNYLCKDSVIKLVDTRHPLIAAFTVDNDTICQNSAVLFSNTSTISLQPGGYYWDFGDGSTSTLMSPSHNYMTPGTYQAMLVVHDSIPCSDTTFYTITVDSIPQLSLSLNTHELCTGQSVTATASYTHMGNTGLDWTFGDGGVDFNTGSSSHAYEQPGTYHINLTAHYRVCADGTVTDSVNVHPLPLVNLGPDTVLCPQGDPLFLRNLAPQQAGDRSLWSTGDTTQLLKAVHDGTYRLKVTTPFDCSTSDEVVIAKDCYIDIPNSFTPNGDGTNDYFFPRQLLSKSLSGFTLRIFNRWGQVVYETSNPSGRGWDGRFNNKEQPSGVYIYQVDVVLKNGSTENYTGNVTLLR